MNIILKNIESGAQSLHLTFYGKFNFLTNLFCSICCHLIFFSHTPLSYLAKSIEIQPKIISMPKLSKLELSPKYHMNSIVSQELDRFETERQLEVEAKVFERRKRFSMDFDDISRKSSQNMEHSIKKIQLDMAHQLGWFD